MKYFAAVLLVAAVASAQPTRPSISAILGQLHEAISALKPEPVAVGPAIVDSGFEPIAIGPAIIDQPQYEPVSVGPAWIDTPIAPSPVAIVDGAAAADVSAGAPLVQIILNINQAAADSSPIAVGPAVVPGPVRPEPVQVVEVAPEPVQVVEVAPVPVEPVQVVEAAPVPVEPVVIGTPVLPEAAVVLPEELN
uniref:Cuticle protein n=1 Tax=Heliothis virescens TaxID=7102 RepID=A0A2A4K443_HELVI